MVPRTSPVFDAHQLLCVLFPLKCVLSVYSISRIFTQHFQVKPHEQSKEKDALRADR